jgi:hypothetical protein
MPGCTRASIAHKTVIERELAKSSKKSTVSAAISFETIHGRNDFLNSLLFGLSAISIWYNDQALYG